MFDKLFEEMGKVDEDGNWVKKLASEVANLVIDRVEEMGREMGTYDFGSELYKVRTQIGSLLKEQEDKWAAGL